MLITLHLSSIELDFDTYDAKEIPSEEEQRRIAEAQLAEPVVFEPKVKDYRDYFHLDNLQEWATDVISERSGWTVSSVEWK